MDRVFWNGYWHIEVDLASIVWASPSGAQGECGSGTILYICSVALNYSAICICTIDTASASMQRKR